MSNPTFSTPFKKFAYYSILLVTMHWTCVAPAQDIVSDYIELKNIDFDFFESKPDVKKIRDEIDNLSKINKSSSSIHNTKIEDLKTSTRVFKADISEGIIGKAKNSNSDHPSDNIFEVKLKEVEKSSKAIIKYEVYGVNAVSVSSSINGNLNTGGYIQSKTDKWVTYSSVLNLNNLKNNENYVRFNKIGNKSLNYKIKNVEIILSNEDALKNLTD